jgi:hypothetical protein
MLRTISSIVVGLLAWVIVATVLNFGFRLWLPGYAQAEPLMAFTLAMKIARLSCAAIASLAAGVVAHKIAPASRAAPWVAGVVLLALFLPVHIKLWDKFPIWYHLTFLLTLVPLVVLGASLGSQIRSSARNG